MATIVIVLCLCSSLSSSVGAGLFTGGLIPNTAPHYLKSIQVDAVKKTFDPLVGDIKNFKNTFFEPGTTKQKKDITAAQKNEFIDTVDKTKCGNFINALENSGELMKADNRSGDNVLSIEGFVPKHKAYYKFIGDSMGDMVLAEELCKERLKRD